jgi:Tol biopolymer transport system component
MDRATVPPRSVTEHLDRVLQSNVFRAAGRSSTLLRFLVEQTLNGHADRLKDYTLGSEALGRGDDFDPRTDPIARVEASRLRSRLELYYATEGAAEPVVITLPKGSYVPLFEVRPPAQNQPSAAGLRHRPGLVTLGVLGLVAIAGAVVVFWQSTPPSPAERRLEITTPPTTDPVSLALSPDGEKIVFVASAGGSPRLWLRPLTGPSTSARPLAGTDHASLPFWSSDSKSVGFFADGPVKRIDLETGVVQRLAGASVPSGGTWNHDDVIILANTIDSPLTSVSSDGAVLDQVTVLADGQTSHRGPQFLPDGRHFLYYAVGRPDVRGVHVGDLKRTVSRRLFDADTPAVYVANHLLYVQQGTLLARGFDPVTLELKGPPTPVAEKVTSGTRANIAALSTASAGLIAYRTGPSGGKRQLVWRDRSGTEVGHLGDPHGFGPSYAAISPDNRRLAVQRTDAGNTDIWVLDLARNTPSRFTTDPEADIAPFWSPGEDRMVFSSRRGGRFNLYEKSVAGGKAQELLATDQTKSTTDWSRDGRVLLFRSFDPEFGVDIWAMPMTGDRKPFVVVRTKFDERDARFSPDGRWIAYQSNDSGRFEIYVQPFGRAGERTRISSAGGVQPQWSHDGSELFYLAPDGQLVAVPVVRSVVGQPFEIGRPAELFRVRVAAVDDVAMRQFIVSKDATRFLLDTVVEEAPSPITVILNWRPPEN